MNIENKAAATYSPYLPLIPDKIFDKKCVFQCLTNHVENEWKLLFEKIADIPEAFAHKQDYDFSIIDAEKWQDVIVPSSLIMQGFDIENNTEYYYKKIIKIPKDYVGNRIFLRFEGVYSNARVWVNNKFIKSHIGGFTVWDVDITDFAEAKEITLIVGVADIEGNKKSVWNTDGKYQSNSAWASYYAHHNIGGIIRNITMFCLPQKAILQTHIDTFVNGSTSIAKVNMLLSENCKGLVLKTDIIREGKIKAAKEISVNSADISFELEVLFADLWDAEHPNLYILKTVLCDKNGISLQENTMKFGFREITYGGKNNTDKNKVYVNGKEIKLRGVCRHDVSRLYGRSLTKEDIYNEIKTYKEHNVNHIRTSHYPVSDYMLEVCDELGMYVEQENAACFKGANGFDIYNSSGDFLNSFKEMVESSRNHPSVIIWSIANESGFEKSAGFRDCYNYVKNEDITRPVIFSYPCTVASRPLPYDIYSKHYAKVTSKLGRKDMPILHDEFAHVPCYNIDDLKYDNSCRVFWGESIKRGWDNIFNTDGALGCDIWAAIDDVFYLPEKKMEKHQKHLKGECAGYGEWGCIFDAFKRLKPEAYLTKKAFTPVKINSVDVYGDEIRFKVQNRFDHTNLNEVSVTVKDKNGKLLYSDRIQENIEPHSFGTISLLHINCTDNMKVEFSYSNISVESCIVNKVYDQLKINPSAVNPLYAQNCIMVGETVKIRGMHLYTGLNKFDVLYKEIVKTDENTYTVDFGFGRVFLLTVNQTGNVLNFKVEPKNKLSSFYLIGEIGVDIELSDDFKSVSWHRNSLYNDYPNNHIARDFGTAYRVGKMHNYDDTDMNNITWEDDMSSYAYYEKASKYNRFASNDFKTKRLNISSYLAETFNNQKVLINTDCININAYANPLNAKLQISKGNYKRSILWGNYWGERFNLNKQNTFEFSVCFE